MLSETLVESVPTVLHLNETEVALLRALGRRLVSSKAFWGDELPDEETNDAGSVDRSVIRCTALGDALYSVIISDNIGIVAFGSRQLVIQPKIAENHFRFLLGRSDYFPRLADDRAVAQSDRSLWDLVASWFITALEIIIRRGLLSDYHEQHDRLTIARGNIQSLKTADLYYRGDVAFACDYEEYSLNSALNRVLRAAALSVAQAPLLKEELRSRARRSLSRLEDVGTLQHGDLRVTLERRTAHYADAFLLARHVLHATGRTAKTGADRAWTFLIRTPELIENAVRNVLREGLAAVTKVEKRGRQLTGTKHTLNPDLVFSGKAVGDVKYKLSDRDWSRDDLYQITAFATGLEVPSAAIFTFKATPDLQLPPVQIGNVRLRAFLWDAVPDTDPQAAADDLVSATASWLAECST